ncbi:MAG: FecR domain-containing protein [Bacteroidia bacterium]|nr:FecR domain-containing protein [Bacteroidia bacterium]
MKKINYNSDFVANEKVDDFPEIDLQYEVSKDEVWKNLLRQIGESPSGDRSIVMQNPFYRIAIAASLILLLGMATFLRFYSKTVYSPAGQHLTLCLPDSSFIELNAQSTVKYHPYWFSFSRTVTLDGEAFFKVISGNRFKVISERGETTVLGTSFNIYSRNNDYNVTCFTGRVRVVTTDKNERVLLNPNERAFINKDGFLRLVQEVNSKAVRSWMDNMFIFTGSSIIDVLQEIERQYNIKIVFRADPNLTYTGNFSKSLSEKEVLDLVCTSLGLKFEARSGSEFLVD